MQPLLLSEPFLGIGAITLFSRQVVIHFGPTFMRVRACARVPRTDLDVLPRWRHQQEDVVVVQDTYNYGVNMSVIASVIHRLSALIVRL